jgi:hypothetical protein
VADAEVDWGAYFASIKTVCPWSLSAWKQDKIKIHTWHSQMYELDELEARIYTAPNHTPRQLKKMCNRFNLARPHEEWLWSHPVYGNHSAPIACFIQQDRARLEHLRFVYAPKI